MAHMYNICHFWGEELLDSGLLGRGKIQEKLQEYIPLARAPSTQPKRQKRYDWPAVFGLSFLVGLSLGAIVGAIAGAIYGAIDDEESGTWWLGMINLNALIGAGIGTGVGGVIGIVSPFMFVWTNY